jgi:hypothetical protein
LRWRPAGAAGSRGNRHLAEGQDVEQLLLRSQTGRSDGRFQWT